MTFKIETKEKFQEIHLLDPILTANMTDDLIKMLSTVRKNEPHNAILSIKEVQNIDLLFAEKLNNIQTEFYDANISFVICEMQESIETELDAAGILENMNVTPTLSEAWDLVQMEEIERELMSDWE